MMIAGAEQIARAIRLIDGASTPAAADADASIGTIGASSSVSRSPLPLTTIDLSDTKLSVEWRSGRISQQPECVVKLLKGFGRATQLTSLALAGNMLDSSAALALASWLSKPSARLLTLDLSRNAVGDAGGEAIAKALRTNASLTSLHLDECMLTDIAACERRALCAPAPAVRLRRLSLALACRRGS